MNPLLLMLISSTFETTCKLFHLLSYLNYSLRLQKGWSVLEKNKMNKSLIFIYF